MCRRISSERILILFFFERRWSLLYLYFQDSSFSLSSFEHFNFFNVVKTFRSFIEKVCVSLVWSFSVEIRRFPRVTSNDFYEHFCKLPPKWVDSNACKHLELSHGRRCSLTAPLSNMLHDYNSEIKTANANFPLLLFSSFTLHPIPFHCSDILRDFLINMWIVESRMLVEKARQLCMLMVI